MHPLCLRSTRSSRRRHDGAAWIRMPPQPARWDRNPTKSEGPQPAAELRRDIRSRNQFIPPRIARRSVSTQKPMHREPIRRRPSNVGSHPPTPGGETPDTATGSPHAAPPGAQPKHKSPCAVSRSTDTRPPPHARPPRPAVRRLPLPTAVNCARSAPAEPMPARSAHPSAASLNAIPFPAQGNCPIASHPTGIKLQPPPSGVANPRRMLGPHTGGQTNQ